MPKKNTGSGPETPEWIVTFSDIISLLVTFFVLLLTYSDVNSQKLMMMKGSLQGSMGVLGAKEQGSGLESRSVSFIRTPKKKFSEIPGPDLDVDEENVSRPRERDRPLPISESRDKTCFRLKTEIFFDPGSTVLPGNAAPVLASVANVMRYFDNTMSIKGYADIEEGETALRGFRRAGKRAYHVWHYFVDQAKIAPERLSIAACDTEASSLGEDPLERKHARRVEIIIWNKSPQVSFDKSER